LKSRQGLAGRELAVLAALGASMAADDQGGWGKGLTYGFEVAVGCGLGAVVGAWWDKHHQSGPWGILIGLLIGCSAGMYLLIKDVSRMNKD
jgi:F0F1-type ATP synthase assembly protein I